VAGSLVGVVVAHVEPAEAQPVLDGVELGEAPGELGGGHVAFGQALVAEPGPDQHLVEAAPGLCAQLVEPLVEPRHVRLLVVPGT
jgi:hypothetical protein